MQNTITFPSKTQWATGRTNDGALLTTTNTEILLPIPIYDLVGVTLKTTNLKVDFHTINPDGSKGTQKREYIDHLYFNGNPITQIDITPYVVEYSKWLTLESSGFFDDTPNDTYFLFKDNTAYYKRYGQSISIVNERSTGGAYTFASLVQSAMYSNFYGQDVKWKTSTGELDSIIIDETILESEDPRKARFRIEYIPVGNTSKIDIPKVEPQPVQFAIPYNQQQKIISNIGQGRQAQLTSNMLGVETKEAIKVLKDPADKLPLYSTYRDGDDVWVLVEHDLTIANQRTIDKETWAKNWAVQSQFVGVNRQARTWDTPAEVLERNVKVNEYLYITSDLYFAWVDIEKRTRLLSTTALTQLINSLMFQQQSQTECNIFWIYGRRYGVDSSNQPVYGGVATTGTAYGFGNTLVFTVSTVDNLSGGKRREITNNDETASFCPDVYYCEDDGTAPEMRFICGSEYYSASFQDLHYPESTPAFIRNGTLNARLNAPDFDSLILFDTGNVLIEKDPSEQINFTYLLSMLTHESDLIIGTGYANGNLLVKNAPDGGHKVKYWLLDKPLPKSAQVCSKAYLKPGEGPVVYESADQQNVPYTIDTSGSEPRITFNTPQGYAGVCITDMDNNIMLCHNAPGTKTYKFMVTRDYDLISYTYEQRKKQRQS